MVSIEVRDLPYPPGGSGLDQTTAMYRTHASVGFPVVPLVSDWLPITDITATSDGYYRLSESCFFYKRDDPDWDHFIEFKISDNLGHEGKSSLEAIDLNP